MIQMLGLEGIHRHSTEDAITMEGAGAGYLLCSVLFLLLKYYLSIYLSIYLYLYLSIYILWSLLLGIKKLVGIGMVEEGCDRNKWLGWDFKLNPTAEISRDWPGHAKKSRGNGGKGDYIASLEWVSSNPMSTSPSPHHDGRSPVTHLKNTGWKH